MTNTPTPPSAERPATAGSSSASHQRLAVALGLPTAIAIVVGEVIGSGIFLTPRSIAHALGDRVGLILALWAVCGVVNLCGALTLAELATMFPHAGGTYVFLREAYGRAWSFLWCWAEFWIIRSGGIAALAFAMTYSLLDLLRPHWELSATGSLYLQCGVAAAAILVLGVVNIIGVQWGGAVQVATTVVKVAFVLLLAALPLLALATDPGPPREEPPLPPFTWVALGATLSAIMFTYDGWGNVTLVAEEVRNPGRNLPLALAAGVTLLTLLYVGAAFAYHSILGTTGQQQNFVVARAACEALFGPWGGRIALSMIMVSVFGALNGNILCGPRILYALARDHAQVAPLARIDPRFGTPVVATAALCLWSIALIGGGLIYKATFPKSEGQLFDLLYSYSIFGGSIFYFTAVAAVFVFRIRRPQAERPYRTWGYPIVPVVFLLFYVLLLAVMLYEGGTRHLFGLSLIAVGGVVYVLFFRQKSLAPRTPTGSRIRKISEV